VAKELPGPLTKKKRMPSKLTENWVKPVTTEHILTTPKE
jgi:hypothetical protein